MAGTSLERGRRARVRAKVGWERWPGRHWSGAGESGSERRRAGKDGRGEIGAGTASRGQSGGGRGKMDGESLVRGGRGRVRVRVGWDRWPGRDWSVDGEPGSERRWAGKDGRGIIGAGPASPGQSEGGLGKMAGASSEPDARVEVGVDDVDDEVDEDEGGGEEEHRRLHDGVVAVVDGLHREAPHA